MEKYTLQSDDYKFLDNLIKITTSLEKIYQNLYELEINNQKDSQSYKDNIGYLNMVLEVENKLYQNLSLNSNKCEVLGRYIFCVYQKNKSLDDLESIMQQNYEDRIFRRILNILFDKIISSKDFNALVPKLLGLIYDKEKLSEDDALDILGCIELQREIENDTLNGYLTFLQEYIDIETNKTIKNKMISSKFSTCFINKKVENNMLYKSFDIPSSYIINSEMLACLNNVDSKYYKFLKDSHGTLVSGVQIIKLLAIKDDEYEIDKNLASFKLRLSLIKSAFMLMSDDALLELNYEFNEMIENEDYKEYSKSIEAITKCFKSLKKDKRNAMTLSLKNS